MSEKIQAIRGMHDLLPEQTDRWQPVEAVIRDLMAAYGYREIRLPIVEKTELFKRSIGEVTDIVEKEMYSFTDRNGDGLTLRPEGTAGCLRACLEHGLLHNQTLKLWYNGPMFRHERPQKGRYRQFNQLGVETYGFAGADIEAELLMLSSRLWQRLGLDNRLTLQINSLGTPEERLVYRQRLIDYLQSHYELLDEDCRRRLTSNPLRILDSKNPALTDLLSAAPRLSDHLGEASQRHFARLRQLLDTSGMAYEINPRLVRGLDYYCHTVFEWVSHDLGAQGTVCAGGRYDGLITQLGGKPSSAVGFALGMERLVDLVVLPQEARRATDVYLINAGENAELAALLLSEQLRDALPDLRLLNHLGGGSFKNQFKHADRSGAAWALILGDEELAMGTVGIKSLRSATIQETIPRNQLASRLAELLTTTELT